ncbi:hypothetical protein [Chitinophaga sp. LS1]|uniref:hypothetical protein n=1 Tax=Chitinophaga sp. LS1 TaxID=3051176 RepID=UPI002AAC2C51|nr:hypothetical protein [Chitinophaga sp. LS1]WPV65854.1 hypothetical protein QQL36_29050 [Chitinophaga sp. LS1]
MREQNKLLVNKLLARISTVVFLIFFVTDVSFAQCTTDLAFGKAVNSSGVTANNYAYYATDGITTTRWGTNTFQLSADYTTTANIKDNDLATFQAWKVASLPANNVDGYVQPGDIITYKIYVRNTSTTTIGPLTITDKIPTNTNWESGWILSGGIVSFPIAKQSPGGVTEVTFQVKTYENLDGVDWINNTAYVSDGINNIPTYGCDPQYGTCDTVTSVPVRASKGNLTITKTAAADGTYVIDDYITYNIVVKNTE